MPKAKSIKDRIVAARTKQRLGQVAAAEKWGFSISTLQAWEQGIRNPAGLYLEKLEAILKDAGV